MLSQEHYGKRPASSAPTGGAKDATQPVPPVVPVLSMTGGRIMVRIHVELIPVEGTLDTGDTRSFISEDLANQLATSRNTHQRGAKIRLTDGSVREVTRTLVARIRLADRQVRMPLLVLPNVLEPVILGIDFLCAMETNISCATAFTVPGRGLYQWKVMPFGLHSAPATFQRALDAVIGVDMEPINHEKCAFFQRRIHYLGHVISEEGIHTDPGKVAAVRDLPPPTSLKELRQCIGMASWYRRFVPNFATVVQPMSQLLKKGRKWVWALEQQVAFDQLKVLLTTAPVLACPDFHAKFVLQTDASNVGIGAVLTQEIDGQERAISYVSRRLNKAEENYSATEKECLAVIWAIRKLRCYLEGYRFEVITDHLALKWLNSLESPHGRVARWALELQQYQYDVRYRPGKQNVVADALSRQPVTRLDRLKEEPRSCPWLSRRIQQVSDEPQRYPDYTVREGQLYRHIVHRADDFDDVTWKLFVPREMRLRVLQECHDQPSAGHLGVRKTILRVAQRYYWPGMHRDVKRHIRHCLSCQKYKTSQQKPAGHMHTRAAEEPFATVCADFVGPLPRSK
ncbi:hypothetical protein KR044_007779, partial [Drosophila immigrans]